MAINTLFPPVFGQSLFFTVVFTLVRAHSGDEESKPPLYTYSLPWWHPSLEYIARNRVPGPSNHPPIDGLIMPYIMAHTDEDHDSFDGKNGWIQRPPRYPSGHPNLDQYFVPDPMPNNLPIQTTHWHPDIQTSYLAGKKMPLNHPSVMSLLSSSLPDDHPDVDRMLSDPLSFPLPDWHPNLSLLMESKPLTKVNVFSFHPNPDKEFASGKRIPSNHPSVQELLKESLPANHPDVDIILKDPLNNPMPEWHPSLSDMLHYAPTPSYPILSVYAGHPDIEKAYQQGTKLFRSHPSIHKMFEDSFRKYVPNGHPDLDKMFASPSDYPLPDWHPSLSTLIEYERSWKSPGISFSFLISAFIFSVFLVQTVKSLWSTTREKKMGKSLPNDTFELSDPDFDQMTEVRALESVPRRRLFEHNMENYNQSHRSKEPIYEYESVSDRVPRTYLAREKTNDGCHSVWNKLATTRIPGSQWNTSNLFICSVYVVSNVFALMTNRNYGLGRTFGSLAAANIIWLVITATRNSVLTWLLGAPFDRVILYHRFIGRLIILLSIVHLCFYMDRIVDNISSNLYWTGTAALCCLLVIGATTTNWVRRKMFNLFFWTHYLFLGFFVLVFLHTHRARIFLYLSVGFYVLDKMLRFIWTQLPQRTLIFENCGDNVAYVRFAKTPLARLMGRHVVGQYMFVNFPELSLTEWHPFSVSSGPNDDFLEIHIRNLGDHTKKIVSFSKRCAADKCNAWIRVDGPYGHLGLNYRRYKTLLLVGGGIGITPIMCLLKDIYGKNQSTKPHCMKHIQLVWVMPHLSDSVIFMETLRQFQEIGDSDNNLLPDLNVAIHCTRMKPEETVDSISTIRPDFPAVLDACDGLYPNSPMLVFACGPGQMVNQLWDETMLRNKIKNRIDFHHETFEF